MAKKWTSYKWRERRYESRFGRATNQNVNGPRRTKNDRFRVADASNDAWSNHNDYRPWEGLMTISVCTTWHVNLGYGFSHFSSSLSNGFNWIAAFAVEQLLCAPPESCVDRNDPSLTGIFRTAKFSGEQCPILPQCLHDDAHYVRWRSKCDIGEDSAAHSTKRRVLFEQLCPRSGNDGARHCTTASERHFHVCLFIRALVVPRLSDSTRSRGRFDSLTCDFSCTTKILRIVCAFLFIDSHHLYNTDDPVSFDLRCHYFVPRDPTGYQSFTVRAIRCGIPTVWSKGGTGSTVGVSLKLKILH